MKNILVSIILALFTSISIYAVKADPAPLTFVQPDGTIITVYHHGDEDLSWYTDVEGNVLSFDGKKFTSTGLSQTEFLKRNSNRQALSRARRISMGTTTPNYFPHTGTPKALVILVQFPNRNFVVGNQDSVSLTTGTITLSTKEVFNEYLNKASGQPTNNGFLENYNYGSVARYFSDMSDSSFVPQFDVVGPVTVSHNDTYYGANSGNTTDTYYTNMIQEACELVDDFVNFADYDSDNDSYVDLVYIIYAGYSESITGNSENCLWPKSGTGSFGTYDGKIVCRYGINNELNGTPSSFSDEKYNVKRRMNGIGLFCHEFSHTMGLPDLYPTTSTAYVDNQEPEYWDVMDAGEYSYNGYCPTPYSPWEKEVFEWEAYNTIDTTAAETFTIQKNSAVKAVGANANRQILYLQNVPTSGWYQGLYRTISYSPGMLVWRINYASDKVKLSDHPNNTANDPQVAIVPADSVVINGYNASTTAEKNAYISSHAGDLFPGTTGLSELTTAMNLPNYNWGNGTALNATFKYITVDSLGVIHVNDEEVYTGIDSITTNDQQTIGNDDKVYTIDGHYLGRYGSTSLAPGLYIVGHKKIVIR
ncbi:MAG: M6 family metalloprotease domain-containing protein [Prevotella sp.]|jgi:immune inhibitor A